MRWHNYISLVLLAAVAFSGCQNNLIDVNPPVAGSVNSYSWKAMGQLEYVSEDSFKNAVKLVLEFGGDSVSNQRFITETLNGNTLSTLTLYNKFDTMAISGLTPYSVIPVPSNFSLSRTGISVVDGPLRKMKHILALADNGAFVASDDSSNIYFTNQSFGHWEKASSNGLQISGGIKAFCRWSSNVVLLTGSGNLFMSTNRGQSWGSAPFNISGVTALASSGEILYLFASKRLSMYNGQLLTLVDNTGIDATSLASFTYKDNIDSLQTALAIGTKGHGLWYYIAGNKSLKILDSIQMHSQDSISFLASGGPQELLIGTSTSIYFASGLDTVTKVSGNTSHYTSACYAQISSEGNYILTSENGNNIGDYMPNKGLFAFPFTLHGRIISDISSNNSQIGVATDSGVFTSSDSTWTNFSDSLATKRIETISIPTSMQLLVNDSNKLFPGKSWEAGTMVSDGKSLTITATVTDYFDSVKLSNGISFTSIFAIKYTLSDSTGASRDSFPQWIIYYAKNEGPILIDERMGGNLKRRVYRSTK